jgi:phytoene synthase
MEIFGFKDKPHRVYAENLGVYLQIVNMTRDYKEDLELGRLYLPAEDFRRFKLDPRSIQGEDPAWAQMVLFQLARAGEFLKTSRQALSPRERAGLATAEAIAAVYLRLEKKLRAHPEKIPQGKISISKPEKLAAVGSALIRGFLRKGFSA